MKSFYNEKYKETYDDVCSAVEDVTSSIRGDSENTSQYRIIPMTKSKGKNILINAVEFNSLNETVIFIGKQTIGVKLFSKNHIPVCSYSVSRKDGVQIIQIKYPDGTGMEQKCIYDDTTNEFVFDKTRITLFVKDIVNIDDFTDEIIDDNFKINLTFNQNPGSNFVKMAVNFDQNDDSNKDVYSVEEHPELLEICDMIKEKSESVVQTHIDCLSLLGLTTFYRDIRAFRNSFVWMLRQMEQNQNRDEEQNKSIDKQDDDAKHNTAPEETGNTNPDTDDR
ncbi:MAG: hypothetical protein IKE01_00565 [Clostridia bacterium]|nr:hypothetical protein [Clostridia bacterium]